MPAHLSPAGHMVWDGDAPTLDFAAGVWSDGLRRPLPASATAGPLRPSPWIDEV